jgi:hypothetical protein
MTAEHPRRFAPLLAALATLVCGSAATPGDVAGAGLTPADTAPASLVEGRWSLQTPLGDAAGPLLLVLGPGAAWRLEIGLESAAGQAPATDLLGRRGEGWTLTGDTEGGFQQAWHAGWRSLGSPAAGMLGDLLRFWVAGPDAQPSVATVRRWRPVPRSAAATVPAPALAIWFAASELPTVTSPSPVARHDLRRRLTVRGLGRGGEGLALRTCWRGADLQITTARWPGRLTLVAGDTRQVEAPPEVFLPLWPLADLLP